mgnify:FL=1
MVKKGSSISKLKGLKEYVALAVVNAGKYKSTNMSII